MGDVRDNRLTTAPTLDLDALVDTTDREGRRWSVHPTGWTHPVVSGAEGEPSGSGGDGGGSGSGSGGGAGSGSSGNEGGSGSGAGSGSGGGAPAGISATEAARREQAAAERARQDLLGQFGDNVSAEALKKIVDDAREAENAKKDEATRLREQAAENERKATERERTAAQSTLQARITEALLVEGVATGDLGEQDVAKRTEKRKRLLDRTRGSLNITDPNVTDEALATAVASLREDVPALFDAGGAGTPGAPGGVPTGRGPGQQSTPDDVAAARERGKQYRESHSGPKENPFGNFRTVG